MRTVRHGRFDRKLDSPLHFKTMDHETLFAATYLGTFQPIFSKKFNILIILIVYLKAREGQPCMTCV